MERAVQLTLKQPGLYSGSFSFHDVKLDLNVELKHDNITADLKMEDSEVWASKIDPKAIKDGFNGLVKTIQSKLLDSGIGFINLKFDI